MTWTLEDLKTVCSWTPEKWLFEHVQAPGVRSRLGRLSWAWVIYVQRLVWTHKAAGALDRLNAPLKVAA